MCNKKTPGHAPWGQTLNRRQVMKPVPQDLLDSLSESSNTETEKIPR